MKVLLVDDSKAARFAMRKLMEKQGLKVEMAESGEEALEKLDEELVDVVFMDQSMPGMGGIEATQKICANPATSHIPVVLCTGNEGHKLEEMAEEAGAIGVMTKPPKEEHLKAVLASISEAPAEAKAEVAGAEEAVAAVAEEAATDLGPLAETIEALKQQVAQLEQGIDDRINQAVAAAIAAVEEKGKPLNDKMEKLASNIGSQIDERVKDQIASDSSNTRIQLEALRQQVESALDDMSEKEDTLQKEISNKAVMQTSQLLNTRLAELKDSLAASKTETAESLEQMKRTVSGLQNGVLAKAGVMAAAAAGVAIVVGMFL